MCCTVENTVGEKACLEADGGDANAALNTLGFVL